MAQKKIELWVEVPEGTTDGDVENEARSWEEVVFPTGYSLLLVDVKEVKLVIQK